MGRKVSFRIRYERRSDLVALLTLGLLTAAFLGFLALRPQAVTAGLVPTQAADVVGPPLRGYYLTSSSVNGSQALGACVSGYHMASLWEILDTSNLRYDTYWGSSRADSGEGPPTIDFGWVRTGYSPDNGSTAGQANCNVWTTTSGFGTTVSLPNDWQNDAQHVSVWRAGIRACSNNGQVWCAADVAGSGTCAAPMYISCGQSVDGNTSGYTHNTTLYSCSAWNESGPEAVFAYTLAPGYSYAVTATLSNLTADLDVFLLSATGCDSAQCVDADSYGNLTATAGPLYPGTYYVAVDGFNGAESPFTLDLTCSQEGSLEVFLPLVLRSY
jgi:hypothetical protein